MDKVLLRTEQRWYERLYHGADYDIEMISQHSVHDQTVSL